VLGIETSCDETAASVVDLADGRLRVRSNAIGSQVDVHAPYGGVVPELASRAHLERLLPVIRQACDEAGASLDSLHAVAVGHRPGLIGSLLVGTSAAKALAWSLGVPFLGVDHVAAHLAAALLDQPPIPFPATGLVVSGGHTALFRMLDPLSIVPLARTPDDAVGEAFDKGATILGLPYPGGPEIDRLAEHGKDDAVRFPVPRMDFSFSGLKTALLYEVRGVPPSPRNSAGAVGAMTAPASETPSMVMPSMPATPKVPPLDDRRRADLAASYQRALVGAVVRGLRRELERAEAADERPQAIVVGGGVAANRRLRAELEAFASARSVPLRLPPMRYCVDNAAMIAGLGALRAARGEHDPLDLTAQPLSSLR